MDSASSSSSAGGEGSGAPEGVDVGVIRQRYSGNVRANRLLMVAEKVEGLKVAAVNAALETYKELGNYRLFSQTLDRYQDVADAALVDPAWVAKAETQAKSSLGNLQAELELARSNMVKESTRMALNDLGDLHMRLGDYQSALKSYIRTRDYCTSTAHQIAMCLGVIRASVLMNNASSVTTHVLRARAALGPKSEDQVALAKLSAVSGLSHLLVEEFESAAREFLCVGRELGSSFNDVLASEDVALYGGLCALATMSRSALRHEVLGHPTFRSLLESTPLVRDVISEFLSSQYTAMFKSLGRLQEQASVDPFVHRSLPKLVKMIHTRALKQYVFPFSAVDLGKMAEAFGLGLSALEDELCSLILSGELEAKIDKQSNYLLLSDRDPRDVAYERVAQVGSKFALEARTAILHFNLNRRGVMFGDRHSAGRARPLSFRRGGRIRRPINDPGSAVGSSGMDLEEDGEDEEDEDIEDEEYEEDEEGRNRAFHSQQSGGQFREQGDAEMRSTISGPGAL